MRRLLLAWPLSLAGGCASQSWCERFNLECFVEVPVEYTELADVDGDLWATDDDCDDDDPDIHPSAEELCDGIDNDCDGAVDEGFQGIIFWYGDEDGDGYGDPDLEVRSCEEPDGPPGVDWVTNADDCDDNRADVFPGRSEDCSSTDVNCDGDPYADALGADAWYADDDGDGVGGVFLEESCVGPEGSVAYDGDCDDDDPSVHPDADEYCDEIDSDCDGQVAEDDSVDATAWYYDGDGDGVGDGTQRWSCEQPDWYVAIDGDCDPSNADTYPGAPECDDREDNDCDDLIDEGTLVEPTTWTRDDDDDGWAREGGSTIERCQDPRNYAADVGDCDDSEPDAYPGNVEVCDNIDNNCDGLIDDADPEVDASTFTEWTVDGDGDGYGDEDAEPTVACRGPWDSVDDATDCDDGDPGRFPGAPELCGDWLVQSCVGDEQAADEACDLDGELYAGSAPLQVRPDQSEVGQGQALTGRADLDGDGQVDLVVGSTRSGPGGGVHIYSGLDGLVDRGDATVTLDAGDSYLDFGAALDDTQDVDGDGFEDLYVGAPYDYSGATGVSGVGEAFLFLGPLTGQMDHDAATASISDVEEFTGFGEALALGDLDDDGVIDLVVGAPRDDTKRNNAGAVHVFWDASIDGRTTDDADAVIRGNVSSAILGDGVLVLDDVNGDDVGDLVMSQPQASTGGSRSGAVHVFFGPVEGELVSDEADLSIVGSSSYTYLGYDLADPGDVDGDGLIDLLVGSYSGSIGSLVYTNLTDTDAVSIHTQFVHADGDVLGASVSAGDVDLDGEADFLLGSPDGDLDGNGDPEGAAYLFYGPVSGSASSATAAASWRGHSASGDLVQVGGDFDGDGAPDLLFGAQPFGSTDGGAVVWWAGDY